VDKSFRTPQDRNVLLVGETVSFDVVVANSGGSTIIQLPLTDYFDNTCLTYTPKSAQPPENSSSNSMGLIQWYDLTISNWMDLMPGQSFTTTIHFAVTGASSNGFNTAAVEGAIDQYGRTVPDGEDTVHFTCALPASIGDYVWNDADVDGLQDPDEGNDGNPDGINGVNVRLYRDDGDGIFEPGTGDSWVATQVTAGNGAYNFTMLHAGSYWVDVDESSAALTGYYFIPGAQSGPEPRFVTVNYGDTYTQADFGYAGRGRVTGTVFYDWDEDGPGSDAVLAHVV